MFAQLSTYYILQFNILKSLTLLFLRPNDLSFNPLFKYRHWYGAFIFSTLFCQIITSLSHLAFVNVSKFFQQWLILSTKPSLPHLNIFEVENIQIMPLTRPLILRLGNKTTHGTFNVNLTRRYFRPCVRSYMLYLFNLSICRGSLV